jgi:predicted DNA-binding protein
MANPARQSLRGTDKRSARTTVSVGKPNAQQVARSGEHYVAAEIHRRGAYAVIFPGNMQRIDMLAANTAQTRTVSIQVKTRRAGTWQTNIVDELRPEAESRTHFWVFVDLGASSGPEYYIVPESWIEKDILDTHDTYLSRHQGRRAKNPQSRHHSIQLGRIAQWQDRWDLLGIFDTD